MDKMVCQQLVAASYQCVFLLVRLLVEAIIVVIRIRDLSSNQNMPCSCVLLGSWQLVFVIESSSSQFCVNHHLHILLCEVVFAAFTWHIRIKFSTLMTIPLLI